MTARPRQLSIEHPALAERESPVLATILAALDRCPHALAVRVQSGTAYRRGQRIRMAPAGTPDVLCLVRGGRWLGLEVKRPVGGRVSESQSAFASRVRELGGRVAIVTSAREAIDQVEEECWRGRQGGAANDRIQRVKK